MNRYVSPLKSYSLFFFSCQYGMCPIYNSTPKDYSSLPPDIKIATVLFSFHQLTILTCKEESFCKILNFYKGKKR